MADDPIPPARLNPRVPRDLATICLKCLEKEPAKRYRSAAALADDLRRYERGEPITARPLGRLGRLIRWARRRPAAATLLAIMLLVATAVVGGAGWLIGQWIITARAVQADLWEVDQLQQQSAFSDADDALKRARSRLGDNGPFWMYAVVEAARRDHHLLVQLDTIRLRRLTLVEGQPLRFNQAKADREYAEAFQEYGLGDPPREPVETAAQVRASKWATQILAGLDDWAVCAADPTSSRPLLT